MAKSIFPCIKMDNDTKHRFVFGSGLDLGRNEQGFSMMELLVSISILTVIMAAMFSFLWGASKHWNAGKDSADMTDNARIGLNRMTRELKQASMVTSAEGTEISFIVNFGSGDETITYGFTPATSQEPGVVWRSTSTAGQEVTLLNGVENAEFIYFGNDYKCDTQVIDGNVTWEELQACSSDPASKVARVDISITLKAGSEKSQTFVDQAWLRNRIVTN